MLFTVAKLSAFGSPSLVMTVDGILLVIAVLLLAWWHVEYFDIRLRGAFRGKEIWLSWAHHKRCCRKCMEDFEE